MTLTRRRVAALGGVVVLGLLVGGAAVGWWYMAIGRWPLKGDQRHDFGEVPILGSEARVEHTFHLTNRTGDTVVIEEVRPGCGCTEAELSTRAIEPGGELEVRAVLRLSKAGRKKTHIGLILADFGTQMLWVEGIGRKEAALSTGTRRLRLRVGDAVPLFVFAEIQSTDDEPAAPAIVAPPGVVVTFLGWEITKHRRAADMTPARWRGRFTVELTSDTSLADDSVLTVTLGEIEPVSVNLVPAVRSGRPSAEESPDPAPPEA